MQELMLALGVTDVIKSDQWLFLRSEGGGGILTGSQNSFHFFSIKILIGVASGG